MISWSNEGVFLLYMQEYIAKDSASLSWVEQYTVPGIR